MEQILNALVITVVEKLTDNVEFAQFVTEAVNVAVQKQIDAAIEAKVNAALDTLATQVEAVIDDYDFTEIVERVIDVESEVEKKMQDIEVSVDNISDFDDAVLRVVREALR